MFEHFKGKYEVELKFRLESLELFRERVMALNPQVLFENNLESDCYFETEQSNLENQKKSLCIREIQPANVMLWIVKDSEQNQCEAVEINSIDIAKSMLKTMNYCPSVALQKNRSIYFFGEFHLTLDNLYDMGEFVEVAVMTDDRSKLKKYREEVMAMARKLGLREQQIEHRSYRELAVAHS